VRQIQRRGEGHEQPPRRQRFEILKVGSIDRFTRWTEIRAVVCATAPVGDQQRVVSALPTKRVVRTLNMTVYPLGGRIVTVALKAKYDTSSA
jgi:hypothetical protein